MLPAVNGMPVPSGGFAPMLSFWAKGGGSTTGNVLFALHDLDNVGNILIGNGGNHFFQGAIEPTTCSQISF